MKRSKEMNVYDTEGIHLFDTVLTLNYKKDADSLIENLFSTNDPIMVDMYLDILKAEESISSIKFYTITHSSNGHAALHMIGFEVTYTEVEPTMENIGHFFKLKCNNR